MVIALAFDYGASFGTFFFVVESGRVQVWVNLKLRDAKARSNITYRSCCKSISRVYDSFFRLFLLAKGSHFLAWEGNWRGESSFATCFTLMYSLSYRYVPQISIFTNCFDGQVS